MSKTIILTLVIDPPVLAVQENHVTKTKNKGGAKREISRIIIRARLTPYIEKVRERKRAKHK
jgi:hypothetical protein